MLRALLHVVITTTEAHVHSRWPVAVQTHWVSRAAHTVVYFLGPSQRVLARINKEDNLERGP